jgi:hypothetical protein
MILIHGHDVMHDLDDEKKGTPILSNSHYEPNILSEMI